MTKEWGITIFIIGILAATSIAIGLQSVNNPQFESRHTGLKTTAADGNLYHYSAFEKAGMPAEIASEVRDTITAFLDKTGNTSKKAVIDQKSLDCGKTRDICSFSMTVGDESYTAESGYTILTTRRLTVFRDGKIIYTNEPDESQHSHEEGAS